MKKVVVFLLLLFSLTLAACGPIAPDLSSEENQAQLATMVAATVEAALGAPADSEPAPAAEETAPEDEAAPTEAAPEVAAPASYPDFDGLRVAYIKDGNVYVWTEGGSSTGLTSTGDAIRVFISDDGNYVAYEREFANAPFTTELWMVNSDGSALEPRLLVSQAEMNALQDASPFANADGFGFDQVAWRPGTHILAYSTVPRFMGPGYAPSHDLHTIDADTLTKETIFDFGEGGIFTFSPDGTQVALSTPESISLANADGSNLRTNVLTYPIVSTYSEYQYHPSPIWAADSLSLRVGISPEDPLAETPQPTALWYLPVDGSAPTQLSTIQTLSLAWPDKIFSPDMSLIAYPQRIGEPTDNQSELHVAYADGSNDYVVASGGIIEFYGWSPDGTRFVYADDAIYLGSISGDVFTVASLRQTMHKVQWVDASRLIFIYDYAGTIELRISDQDGERHALIDTLTDQLANFDFTK